MTPEEKKAHDEAVAKATEANRARNNDRLERINAIADGADEHRAEELEGLEFKDDSQDREQRAIAEDEAAAKLLQTEGVNADETPQTESDTKVVNGETYYRQIVNGREKWQTLKEIRTAASKVDAADDYLRTAAESVRNASRLALSPQKDESSNVEQVDIRSLLRGVALGEEDAIEKLATVLNTKPSDPSDVLKTIDQRLSFRTELAQLQEKSRDLLENQYTRRLFDVRLNELRAENPHMGLSEAYTSIDQELRAAFPGMLKTQPKTKLERKRTLVNVPTAAARQQSEDEPEGEEDIGSAIEQMAKARGLSPHVHSRRN